MTRGVLFAAILAFGGGCGGEKRSEEPKTVANVAPAGSGDAGLAALPELDVHVICEVYTRAGKKLGAEIDTRLDAGSVTEDEARVLMQKLSPSEAVPVVRAIMKDMHLSPDDVVAYERAHPEIVQRCVSAMTHHLQPSIMRLARATSGISWRTDLARAQQEAARDNKPVLYIGCTSMERGCRELDRQTFADQRVRARLKDGSIIPVYDDLAAEDDPGAAARKTKLHIDALPAIILFDRRGAELRRWAAFVPADVLLPELARAAN